MFIIDDTDYLNFDGGGEVLINESGVSLLILSRLATRLSSTAECQSEWATRNDKTLSIAVV